MSSRSIVSASKALVALLIVLFAAPAWAGKRVVVLDFDGPKAEKFHDDVVAAIKKAKNTIVDTDDWNSKADDLGLTKVTGRNVAKLAKKLKVNGIVVGTVEKRGPRYYVHLRLREGATGEYVAEVEIVVRSPKLGDDGLKVVKEELLPAIKELSTAKGRDDGDDDSDDDEDAPKAKKKKKHGGFDRNADDMDDDAGDDDAGDDDEEDAPPSKHKKDAKKDKATKKDKKKKHLDDEDVADEDSDDDEDVDDAPPPKHKKDAKKDKAAKKDKKKKHVDEDDADEDSDDGDDRVASRDDDDSDSDLGERSDRSEDRDHDDVEVEGGGVIATPSDWRSRAVDVGAGVSATARRLSFTPAAGGAAVQGYHGNLVAGARLDADLFPLAFNRKNHSITRHFGLVVSFDRVLKIQSKLDYDAGGTTMTAILETSQQSYSAGIVYRTPVGAKALLDGTLRYDRIKFAIDKSNLPAGVTVNIPNADYTVVDPGVSLKYQMTPKILVGGGVGVGFVLNTGEMQQVDANGYGAATVLGIDVDAGAAYYVTPTIVVRLDARLDTFGYTFKGSAMSLSNPDGDTTVDVPKGRDTYAGGAITASYEY